MKWEHLLFDGENVLTENKVKVCSEEPINKIAFSGIKSCAYPQGELEDTYDLTDCKVEFSGENKIDELRFFMAFAIKMSDVF